MRYQPGGSLAGSRVVLLNALSRPLPKGELLIARAIGVDAADILPRRNYDSSGKRLNREALLRAVKPVTDVPTSTEDCIPRCSALVAKPNQLNDEKKPVNDR